MNIQDIIYNYEKDVIQEQHIGTNIDTVLTILSKDSKVLLSAPHSVKHFRNGNQKVADINTYGMARYVQSISNCNMITSLGNRLSDPNYDIDCYYKRQLDYLINSNDIKTLIDIHGCTNKKDYVDIDIATNYDKTLCYDKNIIHILSSVCNSTDLIISENKYFTSEYENTIASFVSSKYHIPSIEIEISYNGRCTNRASKVTTYLFDLINKLQKYFVEQS